jgi:hypothetical protein
VSTGSPLHRTDHWSFTPAVILIEIELSGDVTSKFFSPAAILPAKMMKAKNTVEIFFRISIERRQKSGQLLDWNISPSQYFSEYS